MGTEQKKLHEQVIEEIKQAEQEKSAGYYYSLTKIKACVEALMKPLNSFFKEDMALKKLKSMEVDGYTLAISEQDKSTLNQERMIALLEAKGLKGEGVKTVEVVDEIKLHEFLQDGRVTPNEVSACLNKIIVPVLRVTEVKENKNRGVCKHG